MPTYADAISSIESGGRYDIVGPTHPKLGRALGRYQVMEANVGPWTQQYLGRELTADQFLASPEAQDAVFNGRFGEYAKKHGPEGAARAWFAGEGGMNDMSRKDSVGTTVGQYGQKFAAALGQGGDGLLAQTSFAPQGAPAQSLPGGTPPFVPVPSGMAPFPWSPQSAQQAPTGAVGGMPQQQPQAAPLEHMAMMAAPPRPRGRPDLSQLSALISKAPPAVRGLISRG